MDDAKLSQYTAGKVRKSRREKEQEAAEVKKREEEANAAKAYAEFIDAFEGEDVGRKKTTSNFVKASTESRTAYTALDKKLPERQAHAGASMNRVCCCNPLQVYPTDSLGKSHLLRLRILHQSPKGNVPWTPSWKKSRGNLFNFILSNISAKISISENRPSAKQGILAMVCLLHHLFQGLNSTSTSKAHGHGRSVTALAGKYFSSPFLSLYRLKYP